MVEQGAPGSPRQPRVSPMYFPYMIRPLAAGAAGLGPERIMKTWQVMGSGDLERGAEGEGRRGRPGLGEGTGLGVPTPPAASPANDDMTTAQSEFWQNQVMECAANTEARQAGGGLSREGLGWGVGDKSSGP